MLYEVITSINNSIKQANSLHTHPPLVLMHPPHTNPIYGYIANEIKVVTHWFYTTILK